MTLNSKTGDRITRREYVSLAYAKRPGGRAGYLALSVYCAHIETDRGDRGEHGRQSFNPKGGGGGGGGGGVNRACPSVGAHKKVFLPLSDIAAAAAGWKEEGREEDVVEVEAAASPQSWQQHFSVEFGEIGGRDGRGRER